MYAISAIFTLFPSKIPFVVSFFFFNKKCTWKTSFRKLKILYVSRATLSPGKKIHYFHNILYMHVSILWTMTMQCRVLTLERATCMHAITTAFYSYNIYGFFSWLVWTSSVNLTTTPPFLPRCSFLRQISIFYCEIFSIQSKFKPESSKKQKKISRIHTELPWSSSSIWFWMYYCIASLLFPPSTHT